MSFWLWPYSVVARSGRAKHWLVISIPFPLQLPFTTTTSPPLLKSFASQWKSFETILSFHAVYTDRGNEAVPAQTIGGYDRCASTDAELGSLRAEGLLSGFLGHKYYSQYTRIHTHIYIYIYMMLLFVVYRCFIFVLLCLLGPLWVYG